MSDTQAAREALLPCPMCNSPAVPVCGSHGFGNIWCSGCDLETGWRKNPEQVWNSRSILAAAALLRAAGYVVEQPIVIAEEKVSDETLANLLRAAGWTVEEPVCETCEGMGVVWDNDGGCSACPTCNGTGARP